MSNLTKIAIDEDGSYIGVEQMTSGYVCLCIVSYDSDSASAFPMSETYQPLTKEERMQLIKALQEAGGEHD